MGKLHRSNDMSLANDFYATALAAHASAAEVPNVREGLRLCGNAGACRHPMAFGAKIWLAYGEVQTDQGSGAFHAFRALINPRTPISATIRLRL